jgi:hypothetical protein
MAGGSPLFPGGSEVGQLLAIFRLLGTPDGSAPGAPAWPGVASLPDWNAAAFPDWGPSGGVSGAGALLGAVPALGADGADLVARLLCLDPAARLSARAALAHPYFDSVRPCARAADAAVAAPASQAEAVAAASAALAAAATAGGHSAHPRPPPAPAPLQPLAPSRRARRRSSTSSTTLEEGVDAGGDAAARHTAAVAAASAALAASGLGETAPAATSAGKGRPSPAAAPPPSPMVGPAAWLVRAGRA